MYVLTNDRTSEGAAALFYPEMKEQIAKKWAGITLSCLLQCMKS